VLEAAVNRYVVLYLATLLYVVGILVFVSSSATATWPSTLLYGGLFGFFCYATLELTSLSLLSTGPGRWSWSMCAGELLSRRCRRRSGC
jgi:uncharacterized membrane protein